MQLWTARSSCGAPTDILLGLCPRPRHKLVQARGGPEIDELGQHVGEIGLRVDAVQFAALDERSDAGPVSRTLIVAGKKCVTAAEGNLPHSALDGIRIQLDAAVLEEMHQAVPVVEAVADRRGDLRLGGDARELGFKPGLQCLNTRLALDLTDGLAHLRTAAADLFLDRIECGNALERLARDRRRAVLGDIVELTTPM